jgi:hypothetical protein
MPIIHTYMRVDGHRDWLIATFDLRIILDLLLLAHPHELLVIWLQLYQLLLIHNDSFILPRIWLRMKTHYAFHLIYFLFCV